MSAAVGGRNSAAVTARFARLFRYAEEGGAGTARKMREIPSNNGASQSMLMKYFKHESRYRTKAPRCTNELALFVRCCVLSVRLKRANEFTNSQGETIAFGESQGLRDPTWLIRKSEGEFQTESKNGNSYFQDLAPLLHK